MKIFAGPCHGGPLDGANMADHVTPTFAPRNVASGEVYRWRDDAWYFDPDTTPEEALHERRMMDWAELKIG